MSSPLVIENTQANISLTPDVKDAPPGQEYDFMTCFVIGLVIIVVVILLYMGYLKFKKLSKEPDDCFVPGLTQERDDTTVDFNLNEAIQELEIMQNNILKKLSETINV